jgi:hypothetical protein
MIIKSSGDAIRETFIFREQIFGSTDEQIGSEVYLPGSDQ